ncbi:GNAT family N-acetyltransferase [Bacillus vallismortis]|uniref:GNAT family N-acetyltransferase n=1 Tax=Bacillus vallismortis TaxID=72361 RepID=UPI002DBB02B1|nr:GNAT family N-acetyltransferase [Bacillus vallismortis]MEC1652532.1 GNAT family N-acetyltransferase [Bacillus vallismortis]
MTLDISLSFYKPEHLQELQSFTLNNDDKRFTSLPNEVLTQTLGVKDRYPVVILKNDLPVGFFILYTSKETLAPYTNNPFALLLSSLSVNAAHHGKGYAKKAMLQLPSFVSGYFPWCDEIILAVNYLNTRAKQLYLKSGFLDKGRRRIGPLGEQLILHYFL